MSLKKWHKVLLVVLVIVGIILRCSLRFELLMNGYNPFDYKIYKEFNSEFTMQYEGGKETEYTCKWIVQVNDFNEQFNYIKVARTKWMNWDIIEIGQASDDETNTSTFCWPEQTFTNEGAHLDIVTNYYKVFRIRKSHISSSSLKLKLEALQEGIQYIYKEDEDVYIIQISNDSEKEKVSPNIIGDINFE